MLLSVPQYGGLKLPSGAGSFKTVKTAPISGCGRLKGVDRLMVETKELFTGKANGFSLETPMATLT